MNDHTKAAKSDTTEERSEVRVPETRETRSESSEQFEMLKKYLTEWPKSEVIQGLILAVGDAYCLVTLGLWLAARNANEIAAKNFRSDERAWMAFTFTGGNLTLTVGKSLLVPTQLLNTGKTPAKNVKGNIVIGIFGKGEHLDFDYTQGHRNTSYAIQAGTVFPNGKFEESFESLQHGQDKIQAAIITKPMMDDILNERSFVIVHGIITYTDIFGIDHWTTYCRYVTAPSLISDECIRHNDTDNN